MSQSRSHSRRFQVVLDHSRSPRAYRDESNLWRDDIGRIHRLIQRQVNAVSDLDPESEDGGRIRAGGQGRYHDERPHLSIAVFGPSGSGKSSLIRTLADDIGRKRHRILPKELKTKVATLPVMDPTTWAPTDQFLYAFLAAALEEERNAQEVKEHGYPQGLSPVQLAFQEVNEYLRVVDEPERSEEHDPLGLSLQKLERHTSGLRLRQALGELIEELAKEFRAEVVLLPVDDLDMAPDHLVDALQSYQSFLMHPRLIPVFTFTDRMPEELIEVYYKRQMGDAAGHQRLGGTNRLSISEQMSVQFLARCFPVRNRIRLGPAPARVQRALYSANSRDRDGDEGSQQAQVLELLIQASFLLFGYPDGEDFHQIRAALRPSTLRRQFQVVDAMSDCRISALHTPQFGEMAHLGAEELCKLASRMLDSKDPDLIPVFSDSEASPAQPRNSGDEKNDAIKKWRAWKDEPGSRRRLAKSWALREMKLEAGVYEEGFRTLALSLKRLEIGATWATIFNGACWSLLNVHRDTLRELGLFLEDLYSWTPKELRSVVVENILAQDQVTRRTVVDRWFNRTDYRRSQVLSLLAANVFRPWMIGEEPYGDEEVPIREQIKLEKKMSESGGFVHPLDAEWMTENPAKIDGQDSQAEHDRKQIVRQIRDRLTIPAPKGLLWFLNVTLGFYLPQIMARNWGTARLDDTPVKSRMSGNGWDLYHAATNAMRIADAKQEAFSFGMLFLNPTAYRRALEAPFRFVAGEGPLDAKKRLALRNKKRRSQKDEDRLWNDACGTDADDRDQAWRRHILLRMWSCSGYSSGRYWSAFSLWRGLGCIGQVIELGLRHSKAKGAWTSKSSRLRLDLFLLIQTHGLKGLIPGSLLSRNSNDDRLLHGFPKWEPRSGDLETAIESLVNDLILWLSACWDDCIFPIPAGDLWIGWRDCFTRRIHGEYVLGGLWPRLNAAYLEQCYRIPDWVVLGANRSKESLENVESWQKERKSRPEQSNENYRWSASTAADAWSDILLEYWRGCPPILKLLLTCPLMFKSMDHFGPKKPANDKDLKACLGILQVSEPRENQLKSSPRLSWLHRLGLPPETWKEIAELWHDPAYKAEYCLVPSELAIPRVQAEQFTAPGEVHQAVRFKKVAIKGTHKPANGEDSVFSATVVNPSAEDPDAGTS